jgi:hypothetical protein
MQQVTRHAIFISEKIDDTKGKIKIFVSFGVVYKSALIKKLLFYVAIFFYDF